MARKTYAISKALALRVIEAHKRIRETDASEPDYVKDEIAWLEWHSRIYKPANREWKSATEDLELAFITEGIPWPGTHPFNLLPICKEIVEGLD